MDIYGRVISVVFLVLFELRSKSHYGYFSDIRKTVSVPLNCRFFFPVPYAAFIFLDNSLRRKQKIKNIKSGVIVISIIVILFNIICF